jgi:hypothetical protein
VIPSLKGGSHFHRFRERAANKIDPSKAIGLSGDELMQFLGKNLPAAAMIRWQNGITVANLSQQLINGEVVAWVSDFGGHWVRVQDTVQDGSSTYLRIYDPAVGSYEQLFSDFLQRSEAPLRGMIFIN